MHSQAGVASEGGEGRLIVEPFEHLGFITAEKEQEEGTLHRWRNNSVSEEATAVHGALQPVCVQRKGQQMDH